jgi:hypothetical protein
MPAPRTTPRHRRGLTGLAAAAILLVGLAACGGGGDDDAADDPPGTEEETTVTTAPEDEATDEAPEDEGSGEACDIVSDEVVLEVLGFDDIPRREPHEVEGQSTSCIKGSDRTDDLSTASYVNVSLLIGGKPLVDAAASEADAVEVSGLGDQAVFVPSAGALSVAVGDDGYLIQVVKNGKPSDQAAAVTVAEDVLG